MHVKSILISGFKSFSKETLINFDTPITAVVGPNGSGKSNVADAMQWVLGEQSMKSLRGKKGEDLIFTGSAKLQRQNRARVVIIFDNTKRVFPLDFPEVIIERVVYRDGVNEYLINGSIVRLKDIIETLASVSLGVSSHHVISQNEADRILLSNARERKAMIEDALGLRIYHYKINEAERKLEKTLENIKDAQALRKEISGHIRFLKKETEKIEKVRELRKELFELYKKHLSGEGAFIDGEVKTLAQKKESPESDLVSLDQSISLHEALREADPLNENKERSQIESEIAKLRTQKGELDRAIGRLEGILEIRDDANDEDDTSTISLQEVRKITKSLRSKIADALLAVDIEIIQKLLRDIDKELSRLDSSRNSHGKIHGNLHVKLLEAQTKKRELEKSRIECEKRENELIQKEKALKAKEDLMAKETRNKEREYFEAKEKKIRTEAKLAHILNREQELKIRQETLDSEIEEANVFIGKDNAEELLSYTKSEILVDEDVLNAQKKEIERVKIRIEEVGHASDEVIHEYDDTLNRDKFLEKEINDLLKTESSLRELVKTLKNELFHDFSNGIDQINKEFQGFFEILFGGGRAALSQVTLYKNPQSEKDLTAFVEGRGEHEEGLDIAVSLPRKKVKGLEMLSGGERALTSIALLFAMTQVKPPPFLVLDETDAALDEANSRKYGDMLERLAKETQLILITHNRETMSRAEVLYGVTMGGDGTSKLLSVKFDQAVEIAE